MPPLHRITQALVAPFAREIVRTDLAGLAPGAAEDAVAFVVHRITTMPSVLRLGVLTIAAALAPFMASPLAGRTLILLRRAHPPLVGEYLRLVRGLLVSRIWEQQPSTRLGAAG